MEIEIEFNYQGHITIIQCNIQDNLETIFKNFANKAQKDFNSIYFLYSGNVTEGNSIIDHMINNNDKQRRKMNILVNDKDNSNSNTMIVKPKDISCPKCGEIAKINITDYKILIQCKNGHNKGNILLNEFKDTQKVDISKIICEKCNQNNKGNAYKNRFFRCCSCKMNLCSLCKENHEDEHNIINYDNKNYICEEHNQRYTSYCQSCSKNICLFCEKEHNEKNHKLINFSKILPDINMANNNMRELKDKINKFKIIIDDIIKKLQEIKENIDYFYDINKDILNSLNKNINYEILYNFNKINKSEIINDINYIINNKDNNIQNLLNIYNKMKNKYNDEININYIIGNNRVKLFDDHFIKNNKNNCKIIIEDKEYELLEEFNTNKLKKKDKILQIKLKGIQNITNTSYMFRECPINSLPDISNWNTSNITDMSLMFNCCSLLNSLPDISNWNTSNVTDMSCMFNWCAALNSLPDISKWDTSNVTNMSLMFNCCSSLNSLPDISKWNTSNVTNMDGMFNGCSKLKNIPQKFLK